MRIIIACNVMTCVYDFKACIFQHLPNKVFINCTFVCTKIAIFPKILSRFFIKMFPVFFALVKPASHIAKPACIQNTKAAPIKNHTLKTSLEIALKISSIYVLQKIKNYLLSIELINPPFEIMFWINSEWLCLIGFSCCFVCDNTCVKVYGNCVS